jgi:hypothetical protein
MSLNKSREVFSGMEKIIFDKRNQDNYCKY